MSAKEDFEAIIAEKVGYGVPLILQNNIDGVHTAIIYDADLGGLSYIYQYDENEDNPECMAVAIDMKEVSAIINATV